MSREDLLKYRRSNSEGSGLRNMESLQEITKAYDHFMFNFFPIQLNRFLSHTSSKRKVEMAEIPKLLPAGLPAGHFQAREECRGVHIDVSALPGLLVRQLFFSWTLRSQRKRLPELCAARCLVGLVRCFLTSRACRVADHG